MALIVCTECGKEFSDRAKVCPQCGCPIEYILEDLEKEKKQKSQVIIANYNFLGARFVVDEDLHRFLLIKRVIDTTRSDIEYFAKAEYKRLKTIDNVIEQFPESMSALLEKMVNDAVAILISYNIYDCDKQEFFKRYGASMDAALLMEPIVERYLEILDFEEEAIQYKEYLRQQRLHSWSGGGFSIEGAIKGYFKAQILNAGSAFLHMIPDSSKHSKNMGEVARAKRILYEDEDTRNAIIDALLILYNSCYDGVMTELINAGKLMRNLFNEEKSIRITNNIVTIANADDVDNIDEENLRLQCLEAFKAYPLNKGVIELSLMLWEEEDMISYAKTYGFWEAYDEKCREIRRREWEDEIEKVMDLSSSSIVSNDLMFDIIERCGFLLKKDLDVEKYIWDAVKGRLKFRLTDKDVKEIKKVLSIYNEKKILDQKLLQEIRYTFETAKTDNTDVNINKLEQGILAVCQYYSQKTWYKSTKLYDSDFGFSCDRDIKTTSYYDGCEMRASIPKNAKIYMIWTKGVSASDGPHKILAIADCGLFAYAKEPWCNVAKSLTDFAKDRFGSTMREMKTGKDTIDFYDQDLFKLLVDIRNELRKCLRLDTSETSMKTQAEGLYAEIAEKVCDEAGKKVHALWHHFSVKKDIKLGAAYFDDAESLKVPDEAKIYYHCATTKPFMISNLGIYFKSDCKSKFVSWKAFVALKKLSLINKNIIQIGDIECETYKDAKFICTILEEMFKQMKMVSLQHNGNQVKTCPMCGAIAKDTANFCKECGYKF